MLFVVASLVQSHLLLLLNTKIFAGLRKRFPLYGIWECPACLGFWLAGIVSTLWTDLGWHYWLPVAALGHLITIGRDKYLPCSACTTPPPTPEGLKVYLP